MEGKKNTKFIVIIAIFVILLMGCVSYIVYDNFIKEDEIVNNNNQNNNDIQNDDQNNDEDENNKLSEEELNKLGLELFSRTNTALTSYITSGNYMFYQEDDITYNDLNNEERLEYVYLQIPNSEKTYNLNDAYDRSCIDTENTYTCYYEKILINTFEEYYYKMFGLDKGINYEWFTVATDNFLRCEKEENEIICYPTDGGGATDYRTYLNYIHAEENNSDILVYVNLLAMGYNGVEGGIFSDATMNNRIADESPEVTEDNIFDIYGDEAGLYKVTFKKDINDNYYWYSSEIIK